MCPSRVSRRRRLRSPGRGTRIASAATGRRRRRDALGEIAERGENDDARGYPDPRHEVMLIERHARLAGRDILEVGCGNGRLTLEYAGRARRVVALEPDGATIREARRRARARALSKIRFRTQPAQTGIRGGPFDVVLFSYSLC